MNEAHSLSYKEEEENMQAKNTKKKERIREVIWFNHPFTSNVKISIAKQLFGIFPIANGTNSMSKRLK